jgi:NAD-dependent SIR2 family protein deacetylase
MSLVFILGAGASYGDSLKSFEGGEPPICKTDATPPTTTGFFRGDFLQSIGYKPEDAYKDFSDAFDYIRWVKHIAQDVPVGSGPWADADLEEVLTSVELSREFQGLESDAGAQYVLIRNKLVRYLWRIISICTLRKYGIYSRTLVNHLPWTASLITFNYDLLLDQEQISNNEVLSTQYQYFSDLALERERTLPQESTGIFLKMHGSLNWFRCTNIKCFSNPSARLETNTSRCLDNALGIHYGESCRYCGSEVVPVIIPPLLRKPIATDPLIRTVWGQAREKLAAQDLDAVIVIGFSFAPTDFYVSWLLRTTVGIRPEVEVYIINPANDPKRPEHQEHKKRILSVFTSQSGTENLNCEFRSFSEIGNLIDRLKQKGWVGQS